MSELNDSTSLPDGWISTSLDKVAEIIMGQSPPGDSYNQEGEGIPLINGPVEFGSEPFSKTIKSKFTVLPTKMCEENDLILCVRGSTTGRMNIAGFDACIGRGVAAIRYKPYQQYVNLFIHSNRDRVYRLGTGSTFPNVSSNNLAGLEIPLPPLNEQRRIVSTIEQLTDRSHKARAALEDVPKLIAQFRQSVVAAAFRGDLTADWREKNPDVEPASELLERIKIDSSSILKNKYSNTTSYEQLPDGWCWTRVDSVGKVSLGRQRSPKYHQGTQMRPYMRSANITWKGWDLSDVNEMNFDDRDFATFKLECGDVLINEGSGSADEVGKPAIWNDEIPDCCFQNTLISVRPFEKMSKYIYFVFLNAALSKAFVEETRGVNIHHIGKQGGSPANMG